MKYIKGRVLNIDEHVAQIFTQDGDIVRIKRLSNMKVGQQIICTNDDVVKRPISKRFRFRTLAMLPLVLMFLIVSIYTVNLSQVYAIVSLDINPSLSLSINKSGDVIGVKAYNDDARDLLESFGETKGRPVSEVVAGLIYASDKRYITKENYQIYIATTSLREGMTTDVNTMLETIVTQTSEEALNNTIEVFTAVVASDSYTRAAAEGISIGNYAREHPDMIVQPSHNPVPTEEQETLNVNTKTNKVIKGFEKKVLTPSQSNQNNQGRSMEAEDDTTSTEDVTRQNEQNNRHDNIKDEKEIQEKGSGNSGRTEENATITDEADNSEKIKQKEKQENQSDKDKGKPAESQSDKDKEQSIENRQQVEEGSLEVISEKPSDKGPATDIKPSGDSNGKAQIESYEEKNKKN